MLRDMTTPDDYIEMQVTTPTEGLTRVALAGRLDTTGVDRIETRFAATVVSSGQNAIIDLSRVTFIGSMGIRMFITAARSMRPRQTRLAVYGAQSMVGEVLESVSLNDLLPVVTSEADAIAALTG